MSGILPSEQAIETNLIKHCKPAPGLLQSVGESFLAARNPSRYRSLRPQGRNAANQTTKGYPDAYAVDGDGGVHIVEATVTDWCGHIEKADVVALKKIPKVASYVLFVLEKRPPPLISQENSAEEKSVSEINCRNLLIGAGVPSHEIEFIFLNQLVRELRSTRYAHVLAEIGLTTRIPPFGRVLDLPLLGSSSPSLAEYQEGCVVAPAKLDSSYDLMRRSCICVLVGLGGVGKTTLGLAIAHRWMAIHQQEAYYLDAKRLESMAADGIRGMLSSMDMYFDTKSLFIIDNSHLLSQEELAQLLISALKPKAPRLLLLARRFSNGCLNGLKKSERARISTAPIEVNEEDLLAAYELFARREVDKLQITQPSPEILHSWHRVAPDLVLFCAALQAARESMRAGFLPEISEDHAKTHIRNSYLSQIPEAEIPSLMVIAKLATLEIAASKSSLPGALPISLLSRDLLAETSAIGLGETRLSLPHDNLGALVLANLDSQCVDEAFQKAINRDIFQATYVARRQLDLGDINTARKILSDCQEKIWKFTKTVPPSFAAVFDHLFVRAGLPTVRPEKLVSLYREFVVSEKGFLSGNATFLAFVGRSTSQLTEFDQILLEQPIERLHIAVRLASPVELVRLLQIFSRLGFSSRKYLEEQLGNADVQKAFANNLLALNPDEVNQTLTGLRTTSDAIYSEILTLLGGMNLERLFDSVRGALQRNVHDILKLKSLVEFLAGTPFTSELAGWIARSYKNITSFTSEYSELGPQTRLLIGDALARTTAMKGRYFADKRRSAAALVHVIQGATDADTIKRFMDQLEGPVVDYLRFLGESQLEIICQQVAKKFPRSSRMTPINTGIQQVARERIENSLENRNVKKLAVVHYLWRSVSDSKPFRQEEITNLLEREQTALQTALTRLLASRDNGRSKPYMVRALQFQLGLACVTDN